MINYFGYGANSTLEMMSAIIGRAPEGKPAVLKDYELCVQTWDELPEYVREKFKDAYESGFQTYCIRPKNGSSVSGTLWTVTEEERKRVSNWEFWFERVQVRIQSENSEITAETEILNDQNIKIVIKDKIYNPFIINKEILLKHATEKRLNEN